MMKKGATLGPLHGVPFSTKDLVITKGIRTTFGTRLFADNVPAEDAPMVERMLAAGAIQLGKTNTPTMGWIGATHNLLFGITRNPWNLDRTPGRLERRRQRGGRGRHGPARHRHRRRRLDPHPGLAGRHLGHKPTFGLVPIYPFSAAWGLSHIGPMTRTVADAALMMNAARGPTRAIRSRCPARASTTSRRSRAA